MTPHMLSEQEEKTVKLMGKRYYDSIIRKNRFSCKCRRFGIEIEFSLVDGKENLIPGSSYETCKSISDAYIVPEYGSFQIEVNPKPYTISDTSFDQLYQVILEKRRKIEQHCNGKDIHMVPIGIPFTINPSLLAQNNIVTPFPRYLISTEYFHHVNKKGATIQFTNGDQMHFPGNSGLSIINELHVHVQALDVDDLIKLFNVSQMISAPFVSLSANSGVLNGKELLFRDSQISIFEQAEGIFDGPKNIPRVGLFPGYLYSIDQYFDKILEFKPLYYPEDTMDANAFELMISKFFSWTRIRVGYDPSYHMRIEFRPMSTQPTIIENMALTEFYIKILLYFVSYGINLIPEKFLERNFFASMKHGMKATLLWNFGKGLKEYSVLQILQYMFDLVDEGVYSDIIKNKIKKELSPTEKLLKNICKFGYKKSIQTYKQCFQNETPFV